MWASPTWTRLREQREVRDYVLLHILKRRIGESKILFTIMRSPVRFCSSFFLFLCFPQLPTEQNKVFH